MAEKKSKVNRGLFIALEGTDGSGKATQLRLLAERLRAVGYEVAVFDFPRYDHPSSHFVKQYLNGTYGPASRVNPYTASLFYALDRFESAPDIRKALAEGRIVLADRFVGSNMAHQGSKFTSIEQQRGFFVWEDNLEYELLGIPRPNLNIFLRLAPSISQKLMAGRLRREYSQNRLDEHEADLGHLNRAAATYDSLRKLFPKDFKTVECGHDGKILPITVINDLIWQIVKALLPKNKPHKPKMVTLNLSEPAAVENKEPKTATGESTATDDRSTLKLKKLSLLAVNYLYSFPEAKISYNYAGGYYALPALNKELLASYRQTTDKLEQLHQKLETAFKNFQKASSKETREQPAIADALMAIQPQSALVDARITVPDSKISQLLDYVELGRLSEFQWIAKQLKASFTQKSGFRPKQVAKITTRPEALSESIKKLSQSHLELLSGDLSEPIKLLHYWPRNEFELLAEGLYAFANLSHQEIAQQLDTWKYEHKQAILDSLIRRSASILNEADYRWDIICDRLTLNELINTGLIKDLRVQSPTPRFGYAVPAIVEEAKADDLFMEAFDLSLGLYSSFQTAGKGDLSAYTTLMGHRLRCQFRLTAADLKILADKKETQGSLAYVISELRNQAQQVHPTLNHIVARDSEQVRALASQNPKQAVVRRKNSSS